MIIVVLILIMIALTSAYVGNSTTMTTGNRSAEYRLQARYVALAGLNRALGELDGSASDSAVCSHSTNASEACYGNIDGNISKCLVVAGSTVVANMSTQINTATNSAFNTDTYDLATGNTVADGFPDFRGQVAGLTDSAGKRSIPLDPTNSRTNDGNYTVRCRPVGASQSGIFGVYNLRTYGVWKGEVVGFDCYATRVIVNPFDFAAFGDIELTGSGSMETHSYKSGYPPDPGTTYSGTPTQYVTNNADDHHGDVGSNGPISLTGGASVDGVQTPYADAPVPPPISPAVSGANFDTNASPAPGAVKSSVSLGSAASPLANGTCYQCDEIQLSASDAITIYPANGATVNIFVKGPSVKLTGQSSFTIKQPATGNPGTVKIWFAATCTTIDIGGQGVVNTDPQSVPAAVQLLSAGTADFKYTGGSALYGVIYAPSSTVSIGGGADVTGCVIAKDISISGNTTFYYDLSLRNIHIGAQVIYKISSLVEVVAKTK